MTGLRAAAVALAVAAAALAAGATTGAPASGDPLDLLWGHRLRFAPGAAPLVTIRLVEGREEVVVRPRGRARLVPRGGGPAWIAAGAEVRLRARGALPAVVAHVPLLAEAQVADRARLDAARARWAARGVPSRTRLVGGVYGIAGRVVDNRRAALVPEPELAPERLRALSDLALREDGARPGVLDELVTRPTGAVEALDASGARLASGDALVTIEVEGDAGLVLRGAGGDPGGGAAGAAVPAGAPREDRAYRGLLHVTLDASGRLAAVLATPLEELLRGLVPSEMPAGSPREALRAQAVAARSNVLAQLGTRHLADPYVLCSEVHCQAYRGEAAQAPSTDAAVRDTAGEALFGVESRALVDGVYSALCGGHGEDNDAVWPALPDASLRGRPDLPAGEAAAWAGGLAREERLRAFLREAPRAWCARPAGARRDRYRWERRFTPEELGALAGPGTGPVRRLEVTARGVSGRARAVVLQGDAGRAEVEGELRIRRLLGNLPSAMFVADREGDVHVLRGGGWGHGAGLCQWGAIGRAEAGQGYREILRAYYSGAEVVRMYR